MTRPAAIVLTLGLALGLSLGGCALTPVYAGGASGPVATRLAGVAVDEIEGQAGWLVRQALTDRLTAARGGALAPVGTPTYRLSVVLDDRITGFGVRRDDTVTRERRTLRARYQLADAATGEVVLDATAGSDVGLDVVGSEYATIAAETSALERLADTIAARIIARLAASTPAPSPRAD